MPSLDAMTVNLKINPEMSDEAKLILREMIVDELKVVFPDTVKPFEMLREEMQQMVRSEFSKDKDVLEALRDALEEDECHHKQWYLWKLAKVMGVVPLLCDIEDQGIAP